MYFYRNNSIVPTNVKYTYSIMEKNISSLKNLYPFLEVFNIGTSVLGKRIPCIKFGNGLNEVFYSASIHANEWITSIVLMRFIEDISTAYTNDDIIFGIPARNIFSYTSIYICPMVNPDGVDLVNGDISSNSTIFNRVQNIASSFPSIPFPSGWKANIRGVDLKNYKPFFLLNIF